MQQGLEHCPEAKAIREEVFMKEQGFQVEFDDTDREAWHLVLWQDGKALATARLYSQGEGVYAIGRVAVRKEGRASSWGGPSWRPWNKKPGSWVPRTSNFPPKCRHGAFMKSWVTGPMGKNIWMNTAPTSPWKKRCEKQKQEPGFFAWLLPYRRFSPAVRRGEGAPGRTGGRTATPRIRPWSAGRLCQNAGGLW